YLKSAEKELVNLKELEEKRIEKEKLERERLEKERLEKERTERERLEKERLEKEPIVAPALGLGEWFPSRGNNSFMIYEAQLRLLGSLRLFGGGGESSDKSSYIGYFGVRIGDKLNIGVGRMNSSALEEAKLMLTGGFSLGTDRVRLEGSYFYVPENEDANGIRAILGIRF
ncbi:MAG: hypothetical protein U9R03_01870, partial [Candidatus Aerophobetes bacterium]|nr:hypothetical protein [Candidatus Aerophobetes bacterium]